MSDSSAQPAPSLIAARAGSQEALGQALEACRGYLLQVAQRELGPDLQPKGGASDLVQETLMEAFRDFSGFQGDTQPELLQWLRRLLLNNLADFTRKFRDASKRRLDKELALEGGADSTPRGYELTAAGLTPSRDAIAHEQHAAIQHVLAGLPEDYRRVILLRYQEARAFEQIGQEMGLTANGARKLLMRAVERVHKELGESAGDSA